jgi:peptidoglycan/xylan/chitin deacetylase (PgdA/CDA1 family)
LEALQEKLGARRGVVILCYHALSDALDAYPYRTRATAFDAHLSFLNQVFDILPAVEAVEALKDGTAETRTRPIAVITFDDGYRDNWTDATPILEKHGTPGMLFASRDLIQRDGDTYMSEDELRQLAAHPLWQVGAHGVSHNVLPGFLPVDQEREMTDCNAWLSDLLGAPPVGFAYPQGQISETTVALARRHYDFAFSTDQRLSNGFDAYQIRRHCPVQAEDDVRVLARALVEAII